MARIGFCSGSYQSQALNADAQATVNWYPEPDETSMGESAMMLYPSPGTAVFANLPGMRAVLTEFYFRGRYFAIAQDLSNQYLWEVDTNGNPTKYGALGQAGGLCSMVANNALQLLINSSGRVFIFLMNISTPANPGLTPITEIDTTSGNVIIGPVSKVQFSDGFFIALIANSQTIQTSALLNGTASGWSPLSFSTVSVFADPILAMLVDHREVWLWGPKQTIPYFDAGAPIFPYLPVPGGFIEQGIIAPESPVKLDNSVFWLGGDERGSGIAWRAQGYLPSRISTFAMETAWQSYARIDDAVGYSYQDQGHSFWHLWFPTANKSWRFDVATSLWSEVSYWNAGTFEAHHSRCHVFAFNKHLVGDRQSGNIYQMSIAFGTDAGNPIRRVRRGPPVSAELDYMFLKRFRVNLESGLGPMPPLTDASGNPRDPQMEFRDSRDGGHTWSDPETMDCGQAGEFDKIVEVRRLGRCRSWIPEVSTSEPIPMRIIDAYLDGTGFEASQRLSKQYAKMA